MKHLFLRVTMIVTLLAMGFNAFAQNTVTGTVKDASGEPVIGAAVQVKGTQNGAITNLDGTYSLPGVKQGDVLVFSCIGYATQEITWNRGPVNVILAEDSEMLEGTVVTALGIKRSTKALGYAVTEIKSEDLNPNLINPVSALQGKVAGVEINGSDGGMFGRNKILIRGASTLGKNNQPIFVVDGIILDNDVIDPSADWDSDNLDYGNQLKNLNPDDFESVSVLKGAAATALYGSRGLNGAIIITTKSGRGSRGLGISFTQTLGFDKVTSGPRFQNVFMDGLWNQYVSYIGVTDIPGDNHHAQVFDETGKYPSLLSLSRDYGGEGVAYGWRFDEYDKVEWYDGSLIDSKAYANNFLDAFQTGFNTNTNITLSGGNEKSSIYASLSEKYSTGTLPNNSFNRFSTLLKATHKLNKYIEVEGSVNFTNSEPRNAQPNIGEAFINGTWDRTYNAKYFRDKYKGDHGGLAQAAYGDKWGNIPGRSIWWSIWENQTIQKETVVRPNLKLTVQFTPWLKWVTDGSFNYYYTRQETKRPDPGYANTGSSGFYALSQVTREQTNLNTNLIFDYKINEDWQIGGFLRAEYFNNFVQSQSVNTEGGLIVPNRYFIKNSRNDRNSSGSISGTKSMFSLVGQATASFRDQLFLELTGRNDWTSALLYADKHGNFSYFYPSFSASWLLHETFNLPKSISFFKVRASIAQVGNDTDPYIINTAYSVAQLKNGNDKYFMAMPRNIYDQNLKPERKTSWEVGVDYRMFNNRIGLDATFYKENTRDQIMSVTLPTASGARSAFINAGNIQNTGIELALNTIPVETKNFSWDLNFTFTKNWSKIVELSNLVADYIKLQGDPDYGNYRIGSVAKVGGSYGILMSDKMPMKDYTYDEDGNVTGGSGMQVLGWARNVAYNSPYIRRSGKVEEIGSSVPDFLGSINTGIRFKRVTIRASFDARFGGYVASYPSHYGTAYGYLETALRGADKDHGGITYTSKADGLTYDDGVIPNGIFLSGSNVPKADGSGNYQVGTGKYDTGETYQELVDKGILEPAHQSGWNYLTHSWGNGVVDDTWFKKLNYIAFRDLSVAWAIPDKWANAIKCQGITLQANAHNLGYILNSMPNKENPESVRGTAASEFRVRNLQGVTTYFTFTINARF